MVSTDDVEWSNNWGRQKSLVVYKEMEQEFIAANMKNSITNNTHTRLTALCLGLPRYAGTRKVKPIWILVVSSCLLGGRKGIWPVKN